MAIKEDVQALQAIQEGLFLQHGRYIQGLETQAPFIKLVKPNNEDIEIEFEPEGNDYSFRVDVWQRLSECGYTITATRNLGDGLIETVVTIKAGV